MTEFKLPKHTYRTDKTKHIDEVVQYLRTNYPYFSKFDIEEATKKFGNICKAKSIQNYLLIAGATHIKERVGYSCIYAWADTETKYGEGLKKEALAACRIRLEKYWDAIKEIKRSHGLRQADVQAERLERGKNKKVFVPTRQVTLLDLLVQIKKD